MNLLLWMLIGGLIGWIAALLIANSDRFISVAAISSGVVGAILGGVISQITMPTEAEGYSATSFFVAITGAVTLTTVMTFVLERTNRK